MGMRPDTTPFRDMPPGIQRGWVGWARSHDWGDGGYLGTPAFINDDGRMDGIAGYVSHGEGKVSYEQPTFANSKAMADWAGY